MMRGCACFMVLAGVLSGCLSTQPSVPSRFYIIDPKPPVTEAEPAAATVGVRPLLAARPYRLPIAFIKEGNLLQFSALDSWSEEPGTIVTRALTDALTRSGRFRDVGDAADMARPDLMLTGELRAFHEDRTLNPPQAVAEVHLELRQARGDALVWQGTLRESEPLAEDTSAALADAMAIAIARLVGSAVGEITAAPLPAISQSPPPRLVLLKSDFATGS